MFVLKRTWMLLICLLVASVGLHWGAYVVRDYLRQQIVAGRIETKNSAINRQYPVAPKTQEMEFEFPIGRTSTVSLLPVILIWGLVVVCFKKKVEGKRWVRW